MIKKISILLLATLLVGLSFNDTQAFAIDASKLDSMMTISPPREKIVLIPGEIYEGSINISHPAKASQNLKYSAHIGSFNLRKDENGNADYDDTDVDTITSYNQMMDWITLGKEDGTVAPGTTDVLTYTITVPEDAPAGGQYASIIIRNDTDQENENNGNVAIQNVVEFAVGILAEVAGETYEEGLIIENNIPSFMLSGPLTASSIVRNNGNVHTDASYILQVWPLFSEEEICTNEENPSESLIMPDTERFHTEECNLPSIGIFRAKQTIKIFGEESIVEKTIIICPIWLLFIAIFIIFALIFYFIAKSKARKKATKASQTR